MKKFERSDDSKLHPFIGCWWFLTATKNIMFWEIFQVFGSDKTPFPEVTNLDFYLQGALYSSPVAKEQEKNWTSLCLKKERQR